jgi:hypothetical protein
MQRDVERDRVGVAGEGGEVVQDLLMLQIGEGARLDDGILAELGIRAAEARCT